MPMLSLNKIVTWEGYSIIDSKRERVLWANDFQHPWFLRLGWEKSRLVGLIPNMGTCFLIGKSIIMTNWHVLRRPDWAKNRNVIFDYEQGADGLSIPTSQYKLNPDKLFYSDEQLDFAVCGVDDEPGSERGSIDIFSSYLLNINSMVNIIQHPRAELKKIAIRNNGVKFFDDIKIQYWTDTEYGSSGSPLFNDLWQFIGLHYLTDEAVDESGNKIYFNQGTRAEVLSEHIRAKGIDITI